MSAEMTHQLCNRTHDFAVRIVHLSRFVSRVRDAGPIASQVLRAGTAIGANYRAACRSRSRADFVSRISVVAEEADETIYWLELLRDSGIVPEAKITGLLEEARQLTAIFTASRQTAKSRG